MTHKILMWLTCSLVRGDLSKSHLLRLAAAVIGGWCFWGTAFLSSFHAWFSNVAGLDTDNGPWLLAIEDWALWPVSNRWPTGLLLQLAGRPERGVTDGMGSCVGGWWLAGSIVWYNLNPFLRPTELVAECEGVVSVVWWHIFAGGPVLNKPIWCCCMKCVRHAVWSLLVMWWFLLSTPPRPVPLVQLAAVQDLLAMGPLDTAEDLWVLDPATQFCLDTLAWPHGCGLLMVWAVWLACSLRRFWACTSLASPDLFIFNEGVRFGEPLSTLLLLILVLPPGCCWFLPATFFMRSACCGCGRRDFAASCDEVHGAAVQSLLLNDLHSVDATDWQDFFTDAWQLGEQLVVTPGDDSRNWSFVVITAPIDWWGFSDHAAWETTVTVLNLWPGAATLQEVPPLGTELVVGVATWPAASVFSGSLCRLRFFFSSCW